MNNIEQGPYPLQISDGLDFYKYTMSQLAQEKEPLARVRFDLKNRGENRLIDCVPLYVLQSRLDNIRKVGFQKNELSFLAGLKNGNGQVFSENYLNMLSNADLPPVNVGFDEKSGDIIITTTGNWSMATFWETIVMSELNELYFETYADINNIDLNQLYQNGDDILSNKIARLQTNSGIKIADFGTRRHFSYRWQKHIVQRLARELPRQFIGTSNVGLASDLQLKPIGTFAHEMPMVYAALADKEGADIRTSHNEMLDDWFERYGESLSIALTDTFGSDFFFADFGAERAAAWNGVRHDSGDAIKFGEKVVSFYKDLDIDPKEKTIVFSDGLDINAIENLYNYFKDQVGIVFGWGTTLTNDLGIKPLNIVMKATEVDGVKTVKLSDSVGKFTGTAKDIERYKDAFARITV